MDGFWIDETRAEDGTVVRRGMLGRRRLTVAAARQYGKHSRSPAGESGVRIHGWFSFPVDTGCPLRTVEHIHVFWSSAEEREYHQWPLAANGKVDQRLLDEMAPFVLFKLMAQARGESGRLPTLECDTVGVPNERQVYVWRGLRFELRLPGALRHLLKRRLRQEDPEPYRSQVMALLKTGLGSSGISGGNIDTQYLNPRFQRVEASHCIYEIAKQTGRFIIAQ